MSDNMDMPPEDNEYDYFHGRFTDKHYTIKSKKMKPVKLNKFYVGAEHIAQAIFDGRQDSWTSPSLEAAIAKGKQILEDDDKDCVIIVQIFRVIRRQKSPIVVQKV